MATYYLEVTAGGDLLSVDGTTILAFQTGSEEGGDTTTVTLTPAFSESFDLPSDLSVYYNTVNDQDAAGWVEGDRNNGHQLEVELADGDYTYYAQIRYNDPAGPVTDAEDGLDLAIQATTFTVGASEPTETVTDTFTGTVPSWVAGSEQWASIHFPSTNRNWASNGPGNTSSKNEYVNVTSSCQIVLAGIELDNNAATSGAPDLEVGDFVDVSIGTGNVVRATYNGTRTATSDDALFEWDGGTATVAELEDGGTWGWVDGEVLTILYYDASEQ